ncbi:MAG: ATP-binding protein [Blautia sp.]|nr:ATP-binding protein [Blautia sp.]
MGLYEKIQEDADMVGIDLPTEELAALMQENNASEETIVAVAKVFEHLRKKKWDATVSMYLKTSRLPLKNPKTFDNFDFNQLHGKDVDVLKNLKTLSPLYSHNNIAFIGPPGIGKTHLAQAYGTECCHRGHKAYFLTFTELNQKLTDARRADRVGSAVNGMVKPACLIIDEVGQCVMDRDNTRIFFDVVNRRYNKEGPGSIIFTSNVQPEQWSGFFSDDHSLLCSLDRLFDTALVCTIKGKSYRGKGRLTLAVEAAGK